VVLHAAFSSQVQHAMGVEGIAGLGNVEAEGEAFLGSQLREPLVIPQRLLARHTVLGGESRGGVLRPDGRRTRIELEAAPDDLDLCAVFEPSERRLKASLADIAPRTDDVRPDFNLHNI
jgi:hypothetical protein